MVTVLKLLPISRIEMQVNCTSLIICTTPFAPSSSSALCREVPVQKIKAPKKNNVIGDA